MREEYAYELYKKWGTCLRGMQQEGILDDAMVEEYLEFSHDVPLHEHIGPDPELRRMLESLDPSIPRWVFTASTVPTPRDASSSSASRTSSEASSTFAP